MSDKTLTRMDLADAVHHEVGLSRNDSAELLETVLERMSQALEAGEPVKLSGSNCCSRLKSRNSRS